MPIALWSTSPSACKSRVLDHQLPCEVEVDLIWPKARDVKADRKPARLANALWTDSLAGIGLHRVAPGDLMRQPHDFTLENLAARDGEIGGGLRAFGCPLEPDALTRAELRPKLRSPNLIKRRLNAVLKHSMQRDFQSPHDCPSLLAQCHRDCVGAYAPHAQQIDGVCQFEHS